MVQRAYKLRLYPTGVQVALLERAFGAARWAWNHTLEYRSKAYRRRGESVSGVDLSRHLTRLKKTDRYAWLAAVPSTVLTQKLRDQDRAFANFFAGRARYPRFRRKAAAQSVRYQLDQRQLRRTWRAGEHLALPGLGALKLRWSRVPSAAPKMVTITRDAAGRYFASFVVEETIAAAPASGRRVGLDFGLKDVVVTSDGWKSGAPRYLRASQRRLAHAQRSLSRKHKGSNRHERQRRRVARLHARIGDQRTDWIHKLSTRLIHENQGIAIEDLNVRALARTKLARSIGDAGLAELRRQLAYKAAWHGRELAVIDRWAPTTRTCSACGEGRASVPLSVRRWTCGACATEHDRDINAAVNVLRTARSAGTNARGGRTIPEAAAA